MKRAEKHPVSHHEIYKPRGEKLVETYAQRHVRHYDSYDPRLVIDLMENGEWMGKIIADNFTMFESFVATRLDRVELVRGHHKARLIFAIGESLLDETGTVRHEVYSSDGFIGYAYGDNLDFYIASLFYDDPKIKEQAQKGNGRFDEVVQKHIEKELGMEIFKSA